MSMPHRFHISPETPDAQEIALQGAELHHALHVVRLQPGEPVALFDGHGREFLGRVSHCGKHTLTAAIQEIKRHPAPRPHITLAQAWLHNDKAIAWLLKHGTEIGIQRFLFFRAKRSVKAPRINEKMDRIMLEACKQCGHNWLPDLAAADTLADALEGKYDQRWIGALEEKPLPFRAAGRAERILLLIGPEGDFTPDEMRTALSAGTLPFSLGKTVFRGEVAALHAASLLQYEHGNLGPLE